ncbi:type VII secretion integral membrane protein EccD [Nocardia sp. CDC160]|uniref:type VII secretion integral membrane protein EccD n=1 Tax=Nocardia sp. CDC160 TaxID=3112166 RepID=UPI002DB5BD84|nr:type VII secretion integral membrane protein EccD [Nocardia sp. CDC160]MEC3920342.1 type VII secretion integral membrane protein EccD [Nocardia sp. CDC160]
MIGRTTQVDLALPASVPIAAFIAQVARLIEDRDPDRDSYDETTTAGGRHWTLGRLGTDPIPSHHTLIDAQVFDGELLVLSPVAIREAPALFDDVIDAVAQLSETAFPSWSISAARWAGMALGLLCVAVADWVLLTVGDEGPKTSAALLAECVGAGSGLAAYVAARRFAEDEVSAMFSVYSLLLIFVGTALLVPGPLGSPGVMLACAVTLFVAVAGYRLTGAGAMIFAAAATMLTFGLCITAVMVLWGLAPAKAGVCVVVCALLVVSLAPRVATSYARLPIPPVPTAGAAIDPSDHEPRPTLEGIGAIGATVLPSAAHLADRVREANQIQSGVVVGATAAVVAGAMVATVPVGGPRWTSAALAVTIGLVLCLRGRTFADRTQAGTLIVGGCLTLIGLACEYAQSYDHALIPAAAILLVIAMVAIGFGVVGPSTEISPVARRAGELFEYLLIVAIIPLAFWSLDIYGAARDL